MSVLPADREGILAKRSFAHIATLGPSGEPQSSPVWIGWDGEFVAFSQTKTRQKYRNLIADKRIALSVHDPDEPSRYLEIRGTVDRIEDDRDNAFIDSMVQKYLDQPKYLWDKPGEVRVVVYVRPEHTTHQ